MLPCFVFQSSRVMPHGHRGPRSRSEPTQRSRPTGPSLGPAGGSSLETETTDSHWYRVCLSLALSLAQGVCPGHRTSDSRTARTRAPALCRTDGVKHTRRRALPPTALQAACCGRLHAGLPSGRLAAASVRGPCVVPAPLTTSTPPRSSTH